MWLEFISLLNMMCDVNATLWFVYPEQELNILRIKVLFKKVQLQVT